MSTFSSILYSILLFSILVFVHELGHFLAAKAFKVQVNEFAMFMGPAIFKKKIGETLYSIRCIPIGGYCAMEGEDTDTDNPRSFQKASWWKRLIILIAGAAMNFIIGLVFFAIVFMPQDTLFSPVISQIEEGCTIEQLQVGDEILKVDGEKIYVLSDFSTILYLNGGTNHDLVVLRNGEKIVLDDVPMETHTFTKDDGTTEERYGIVFSQYKPNFFEKLAYVWNYTIDNVRNVRLSLQMLFTGRAGLGEVSGAVGIVDMMSTAASGSESWLEAMTTILYFGGFLAVNLAVMNLLPIPALDGGRVVALLLTTGIQAITKKKIDPKYEGYIHAAGMILLLLLMAIITFKDIFTIFKR